MKKVVGIERERGREGERERQLEKRKGGRSGHKDEDAGVSWGGLKKGEKMEGRQRVCAWWWP